MEMVLYWYSRAGIPTLQSVQGHCKQQDGWENSFNPWTPDFVSVAGRHGRTRAAVIAATLIIMPGEDTQSQVASDAWWRWL